MARIEGTLDTGSLTGNPFSGTETGPGGNDMLFSSAGPAGLLSPPPDLTGVALAEPRRAVSGEPARVPTEGTQATVPGGLTAATPVSGGAIAAGMVAGTEGADTMTGGTGNDTLSGMGGNDRLVGAAGNDLLEGDLGDDTLLGGAGADTLDGGDGVDLADYTGSTAAVVVDLGLGIASGGDAAGDVLIGIENLTGTALADELTGDENANLLNGAAGNDTLTGEGGIDTLVGGAGSDVLDGGSGTDMADYSGSALAVTVSLATGTGTAGDAAGDVLILIENLRGSTKADRLTGDDFDNVLIGGAGADTLTGNGGNDTADYSDSVLGVAVSLATGTGGDAQGDVLSGIEHLTGSALADTLTGSTGDNRLIGGDGDDLLTGGAGRDTLTGGAGIDTASYAASAVGVRVSLVSAFGFDGDAEGDILTGIENLIGSALADTLTGDGANNLLTGGAGNDTLSGLTGSDMLVGGLGDDTYVVDIETDVVTEAAAQGTDLVNSSVDWTLGDNLENLTLTGEWNRSGTGNASDNVITGNSGSGSFIANRGHNLLAGLAGNDTLDGGTGTDSMVGGIGSDTYIVDSALDVVVEASGEGLDTVMAAVTRTLGTYFENLALLGAAAIDGTGNVFTNLLTGNEAANLLSGLAGNDTLLGGAGNDTLDGGSGADAMTGGAGNDLYIVDDLGDTATELADGGTDSVHSACSFTLGSNLENLTLTGAAAINGTGNTLANLLTGNAAANLLAGSSGNDTLLGGGGADTLDGGSGSDSMAGGAGGDLYIVDVATDVVTEAAAEGTDTVRASVSFTLSANVERLELAGSSGITGTGNDLANALVGNSGSNRLSGLAGNDTLTGGAGNDTLDGGLGADRFVFAGSRDGTDTISDFNDVGGAAEQGDRLVFATAAVGTFTYLGTAAFSGGSDNSEARVSGSQVLVDIDGDGAADVTLILTGLVDAAQLGAGDFLFG
ncbi:calcium-binding protein [Paracoccaceae bacterium Fryx2]|nr:calcium-binding protein [Paracoccaceae bacterium Fryx2]